MSSSIGSARFLSSAFHADACNIDESTPHFWQLRHSNCTFWTYSAAGTVAKPTCYSYAGACCFLKTAAAWAGRATGGAGNIESGSTSPLPPPPLPPQLPAVKLDYQGTRYGHNANGTLPAVGRNYSSWGVGVVPSRWGFEGGKAVEIDGTIHIFTAEMYRPPWNVAMRLAHWTCPGRSSSSSSSSGGGDGGSDGARGARGAGAGAGAAGGAGCTRVSTLRTSSNDTSGSDPLASLWEPVQPPPQPTP